MWWWIGGGLGVLVYILLLLAFGLGCIQKSRWLLFVLGLFFPLLWIIGALMPARTQPA
jgi:hypothetical protein